MAGIRNVGELAHLLAIELSTTCTIVDLSLFLPYHRPEEAEVLLNPKLYTGFNSDKTIFQ
jgi:hypothetical protein